MRVDRNGDWNPMQQITIADPAFLAEKQREEVLTDRTWTELPAAHPTPHMCRSMPPVDLAPGTPLIEVRSINLDASLIDTQSQCLGHIVLDDNGFVVAIDETETPVECPHAPADAKFLARRSNIAQPSNPILGWTEPFVRSPFVADDPYAVFLGPV